MLNLIRRASSHFLILTYLNFFIFFYFPYYSFYSLILLFGWLCYGNWKGLFKVKNTVYFYGVFFFLVSIAVSIFLTKNWDSFGFVLPFMIPLVFLFFINLLQIKNYSKGLIFLCLLFLLGHSQEFFFHTTYYPILQISFTQVFSVCLIFLPIFLCGIFEEQIFWKILHALFALILVFILVSSLQILFYLALAYALLLFFASRHHKWIYFLLALYWVAVIVVLNLVDWGNIANARDDLILQAHSLANALQIGFVANFSFFGTGYWDINGNNTYQQIYISFGAVGLISYLFLIVTFTLAVFFSMKRRITQHNAETKVLWYYASSVFLFFILTMFQPNFIHPSIFYFTMAIWGIALSYMDFIRCYKKQRI